MTDLPVLPNGFYWHARNIVLMAETADGVPTYETAIVMTPDNFEVVMLFLNAYGEMFRQHGFEQAARVGLDWAMKKGAQMRTPVK